MRNECRNTASHFCGANVMSDLLNETDLLAWSNYTRRTDLINWLKDNGIKFFYGRGGSICTTVGAINHILAGGKLPGRNTSDDEIRFRA